MIIAPTERAEAVVKAAAAAAAEAENLHPKKHVHTVTVAVRAPYTTNSIINGPETGLGAGQREEV